MAIDFSTLTPVYNPSGPRLDYYLDGDYTKPQKVGAPVPVYPFLEQGDTDTVYFRQPMEQFLTSYTPPDLTTEITGVSGAYCFGDINFRDGGCGVASFERTFGNIPKQRKRLGQSFRYSFQYVLSSGIKISSDGDGTITSYEGPSYSLLNRPYTVDSFLLIDYFLDGDQGNFPLLEAPQFQQTGQSIGPRGGDIADPTAFPLYINGSYVCATNGINILAEDDTYGEYRGAVKCRTRRVIAGPTLDFWLRNET